MNLSHNVVWWAKRVSICQRVAMPLEGPNMKQLMLSTLLFCAAAQQANAHDYYYVVTKHSNKCLHQHGATQGNGDAITQWDCIDQPNVKLERISAGFPFYFL